MKSSITMCQKNDIANNPEALKIKEDYSVDNFSDNQSY